MGIAARFMNMKKILYTFLAAGMLLVWAPAYAQSASASSVSANTSSNWSGYVASGSTYTGVNGSWVVPTASPVSGTNLSADASWVGVGGFATHDLIQAGTEAEVQNGSVLYQAWYEALPAGQVQVPLKIHAGDAITVTLNETSANVWHLIFTDATTGGNYQTDINYASSHTSAEWIEEMPVGEFGNTASYVPLDMFGTAQFSNAYANTTDGLQTLSNSGAQPMTMMNGRTVLATPSGIGSDGENFSVARTNAVIAESPQIQVTQGSRGFRRGGQGANGFTPGTRYQQRTQQQVVQQIQIPASMVRQIQQLQQMQQQMIQQAQQMQNDEVQTQVVTRNGNTIHVQFYFQRT